MKTIKNKIGLILLIAMVSTVIFSGDTSAFLNLSMKKFTMTQFPFLMGSVMNIDSKETDSGSLNISSESFIIAQNIPPVSSSKTTTTKYRVDATAYSSTVDQTDASPFIGAAGTHMRDGVVAANLLPLGSTIKVPDLYGDKIFVVEDRMNSRYNKRVDFWFADRSSARQFGLKKINIEVIH